MKNYNHAEHPTQNPNARRTYYKELYDIRLKLDFHISIQSSWALGLDLGEEFFKILQHFYTKNKYHGPGNIICSSYGHLEWEKIPMGKTVLSKMS